MGVLRLAFIVIATMPELLMSNLAVERVPLVGSAAADPTIAFAAVGVQSWRATTTCPKSFSLALVVNDSIAEAEDVTIGVRK